MSRHVAPENDYRGILELPMGEEPSVAVVIPVYNRIDLLRRTLAGLVAQTYPRELFEVIIADDGSDEDVTRAVSAFSDELRLTLVSQERRGYGAGRARNLGVDRSASDVVVFIDADCIPDPDLVTRHVAWHRRVDNAVVIGSRQHLDSSDIPIDALVSGTAGLEARAVGVSTATDSTMPDDFRRLFYRRTAGLRVGDEAFRSLVSSNFSIRRDRFREVGGFAEDFNRWGGEDTELGWRLFNAGMFLIPENDAAIYHQMQDDGGEAPDWRREARRANDGIIQAKIPHRFYRKSERGYIYETPKVSWLVVPTIGRRVTELLDQLLKQSFTDSEVVLLGGDPAVDQLGELLAGDPRVRVIPEVRDGDSPPDSRLAAQLVAAVAATRGEYIALLHGWASVDHRLLGRAVRRLDGVPRSSIVRCGYQVVSRDGVVDYLYDDALADLDAAWSEGLPVFALTRRREWAKLLGSIDDPGELWAGVQSLSKVRVLRDAMVAVPGVEPADPMPEGFPAITGERTHFINDVTKSGAKGAARAIGRYVVSRAARKPYRPAAISGISTESTAPRSGTEEPPGVTYIGWLGRENFGDEAMLQAVRRLLPGTVVGHKAPNRRLLMLGGGTLINRMTYLDSLRQYDSPRVERAVFGSGVADPDFWGLTESTEQWITFLDTCMYVGVRGPRSETLLRDWGYEGDMEIVGDPALSIEPAAGVATEEGLVVVSPAWTKGELWGGDDAAVFSAIAGAVSGLQQSGRRVAYLSCFPGDDRFIMEIMKESGSVEAPYVAGYADHEAAVTLLTRAEAVLAERLHAAVIAAACGTSFAAIEYRPKIRDFARSVGQDECVIRSDAVSAEGLLEKLDAASKDGPVEALLSAVAGFRARQGNAAQALMNALGD